jgi:hypothetical protein
VIATLANRSQADLATKLSLGRQLMADYLTDVAASDRHK